MTAGSIFKLDEIVPSSFRASQDDVIYIFTFQTEHDVGVNGRIRITLNSDMSMDEFTIRNNCYRLDYESFPINLDCLVNLEFNHLDIIIRG